MVMTSIVPAKIFPTTRAANNQSCLTELLDLIAILQFNQAKLLSLKTASNPSNIVKID